MSCFGVIRNTRREFRSENDKFSRSEIDPEIVEFAHPDPGEKFYWTEISKRNSPLRPESPRLRSVISSRERHEKIPRELPVHEADWERLTALCASFCCRQVYLGRRGSVLDMGGLELAGRFLLLLRLFVDHRLRRLRPGRWDLLRARPRLVFHLLLYVPDAGWVLHVTRRVPLHWRISLNAHWGARSENCRCFLQRSFSGLPLSPPPPPPLDK